MVEKKAFFIDMDGVLHEKSFGFMMAEKLKKKVSTYPQIIRTLFQYKNGAITYDEAARKFNFLYARGTAGLPQAELRKAAEEVFSETVMRPGIQNLIKTAKKKGYTPILLTASPMEIAATLAKKYGVQIAMGTRLCIEKGKCTGGRAGFILDSGGKVTSSPRLKAWASN